MKIGNKEAQGRSLAPKRLACASTYINQKNSTVSQNIFINCHAKNIFTIQPQQKMSDTNKCPLCNRELAEPIVRHHLIPPSKGGRDTPTVPMHKICQAKVHAVFTETELKNYYHTVDRLKEHEDIIKFIKWVSKKELEFFDTTMKKK